MWMMALAALMLICRLVAPVMDHLARRKQERRCLGIVDAERDGGKPLSVVSAVVTAARNCREVNFVDGALDVHGCDHVVTRWDKVFAAMEFLAARPVVQNVQEGLLTSILGACLGNHLVLVWLCAPTSGCRPMVQFFEFHLLGPYEIQKLCRPFHFWARKYIYRGKDTRRR